MKLNLGCQNNSPGAMDGWLNVDIENADIIIDLSDPNVEWKPIPQCDVILASHILEHMTRQNGKVFLKKIFEKLNPGGVVHIAVPNMDKFVDCKATGDFGPVNNYSWQDFNHYLGGDHREPNPYMRHKYMYCFGSLAWTLQEVGFTGIKEESHQEFHSPLHEAISLYVRAEKPGEQVVIDVPKKRGRTSSD